MSAKTVAIVPIDHRLASKEVLQPEDFEGENFISYLLRMEARRRIDALMLTYGVNRRITMETPVSSVIIKLVETGAGVSIIDPLTASFYTGGLLKVIPFEDEIVDDYSLVISKRNTSTLVLKPFIDHVRREIRKVVPQYLIVQN